jgi:hypothetical protein
MVIPEAGFPFVVSVIKLGSSRDTGMTLWHRCRQTTPTIRFLANLVLVIKRFLAPGPPKSELQAGMIPLARLSLTDAEYDPFLL